MKNRYNLNDIVFYVIGISSNPMKVTIIGMELVREVGEYVVKYSVKSNNLSDLNNTFTNIREDSLHNTRLEALKAVKHVFEEKLNNINQLILSCKD